MVFMEHAIRSNVPLVASVPPRSCTGESFPLPYRLPTKAKIGPLVSYQVSLWTYLRMVVLVGVRSVLSPLSWRLIVYGYRQLTGGYEKKA
jgi:hypothetical protein